MTHNENKRESTFDRALQLWFHAITGHFCFSIFLGVWSFLPLPLIIDCMWLFVETGGIIFVVATVPLAAVSGGLWAAVHGMNRQLQFGYMTYLFKELWKHMRQSFLQGACFGLLLMLVCTILYLPIVMGLMLQKEMPFGLVCIILPASALLPVIADYTFYQISRWELGLFAAIRNSFFLMRHTGWRSIVICVVWLTYYVLLAVYPLVMVPLSLFCGLMSVLNMTTQALFAPKIDTLMAYNSGSSEIPLQQEDR